MPYDSTSLEPMRAQNIMSTVSNGTGLHTCVGGGGYKRKGLGEGKGGRSCLEHLLQTVDINGKNKRSKWKLEVTSSRSHSAWDKHHYPPPFPPATHTHTHTHTLELGVYVLYTAIPWYHASGIHGQYFFANWTHMFVGTKHDSEQCHCMSEG